MRSSVLGFLFIFCLMSVLNAGAQAINRTQIYNALSNSDTVKINEQLKKISQSSSTDKQAFLGVLNMRKAEFVKGVKYKLELFKVGNKQLEQAITKNSINAEYRFLRLLIQENAPAFLNYRSNIKEDVEIVKTSYSRFLNETQHAILDYCKQSKVLKAEELKK